MALVAREVRMRTRVGLDLLALLRMARQTCTGDVALELNVQGSMGVGMTA